MLLEALFADLGPNELIEVRIINKHKDPAPVEQRYFSSVAEALAFGAEASKREEPYEVYFGVSPRKERAGTKAAVSRVHVLWVDIDVKGDVTKDKAWQKATEGVILPPTAIIDSGSGFHVYWMLTENIEPKRAEDLMTLLEKRLGTDAVHDVSRVLRVPGTLNKKHDPPVEVRILHFRDDLKYDVSDVSASLLVDSSIAGLITSGSHQGYRSRSERDFAVARELLKAGMAREAIRLIFRERPVGAKVAEAGEGYLERTLANADKKKQPGDDIPDSVSPPPFVVKNNCLYFPGQSGRPVQVSTFDISCTRIIEALDGSGDVLMCTIKTANSSWKNIPLPRSCFSGVRELIRSLPVASWQWLGSEKQVRLLLPWLIAHWKESGGAVAKSTSIVGRHQHLWVAPKQLLSKDGVTDFENSNLIYLASGREAPGVDYTFPSDEEYAKLLGEIVRLLPRVNHPSVIWPIAWWYMAAPLKAPLESAGIRFPILDVFGTRGSGKTSVLLRLMQPLAGIAKPRSYDCSTTPFVLLSLLSSTNGVPIAFSDFRRQNLTGEKYNTLLKFMLLAYDVGYDARGRPNQTVQLYPLTAPFSLDGEDPVYDPAAKERTVIVNMQPETIRFGTDCFDAFQEIVALPLQQFAGRYIQYTLSYPVADALKRAQAQIHEVIPEQIPDRNRRNMTTLLVGKQVFEGFLRKHGVEMCLDNAAIRLALTESLGESVELSTGRTQLYVDEFVEDVINAVSLAQTITSPPQFIYKIESPTSELLVHLATAYNWWVQQRRRSGKPVLELPAIKHQLQERDETTRAGVGQYVRGRKAVTFGGSTKWVYVISLKSAADSGMDVPSSVQVASVRVVK